MALNDYAVIDDLLQLHDYQNIKAFFIQKIIEDDFAKAGIGANGNRIIQSEIRGDFVYWLNSTVDVELEVYFSFMEALSKNIKERCFISLTGNELHLALYPPGSFYKKHLDQFKHRNNRQISVIFYMNDLWETGDGGELCIYQAGKNDVLIEPKANRCVVFKSDCLEHAVLKTQKDRYSITGWLLRKPVGLEFL
ncbi:MAG: SM-20-related protein [Bacteroidia bacterium]|jgi:SM-20-related protein